jgi:hypothetical protein
MADQSVGAFSRRLVVPLVENSVFLGVDLVLEARL